MFPMHKTLSFTLKSRRWRFLQY